MAPCKEYLTWSDVKMTFVEKSTWAQAFSMLGCYGIYVAVVLGRMDGVPLSTVAYAIPVLAMIGAAIVLSILVSIAVAVVTQDKGTSDERDTTIGRAGERIGHVAFSLGALFPLGLAMLNVEQFWIANALLLAYFLSSMASISVKLFIYRRGF